MNEWNEKAAYLKRVPHPMTKMRYPMADNVRVIRATYKCTRKLDSLKSCALVHGAAHPCHIQFASCNHAKWTPLRRITDLTFRTIPSMENLIIFASGVDIFLQSWGLSGKMKYTPLYIELFISMRAWNMPIHSYINRSNWPISVWCNHRKYRSNVDKGISYHNLQPIWGFVKFRTNQ